MRTTLVLIAAMLFACSASAQQPNLDSLYAVWQDEARPDSQRVNAYYNYIWDGHLYSRPDTAVLLAEALHTYAKDHNYPKAASEGYYLQGTANLLLDNYTVALENQQMALAIEERVGNKPGIARIHNGIGNIHQAGGDHARALEHYQKVLSFFEELGDKHGVAGTLANMGVVYQIQGNYPRSLEYLQKAMAVLESIGEKQGLAMCLGNISFIYKAQGDNRRALEYLQKCLPLFEEIGDMNSLNIGYFNIASIHQELGDHERALENYNKGLSIAEEIGEKQAMANGLGGIAKIHSAQGNYPLAMEFVSRGLAIFEELGDKQGISAALQSIGTLYGQQGKQTLALDYCRKSLALAEEIGVLDGQRNACECLYDTYKALGSSDQALFHYERMILLRDSMYNEENTKKLTQLEMQYEFDKKEAATLAEQEKKDAVAAQELKRQKLVRNGIGGGLAFALLFLGVVWRQRNRIGKEKKRSEELLLNILPEEVAEELKAKGSAEAVHIDQVSVLFTDFKGFTAMSEVLSPRDLVKDLNVCFSEFDRIMEKYGIEKIKTIGDAYMAAGGLPTPNTTHATDVIKAAFEMRDFIAEGKARKVAAGLPNFEIRIGVHTGPVVAGIVGVKKFSYDIWGDTVNTASRMESSGEVGQVNISEATYAMVKDASTPLGTPAFTFTPRGKVQAKGKGEMEMYFVEQDGDR
jgi:adenylate cyclase